MIYYYIMLDPDKPKVCKLGITKNPDQRLRAYRTAAPSCTFYKLYKLPEKKHEKKILNILSDVVTIRSEVAYCPPHFAQRVVESYFTDNDIEFD